MTILYMEFPDLRLRLQWLEGVNRHPGLSLGARVFAFWIFRRYNDKFGYAWPSYSHVAQLMGVDRSTAMRAFKALATSEWIHIHRVRRHTNHFYLRWPSSMAAQVGGAVTAGLLLQSDNTILRPCHPNLSRELLHKEELTIEGGARSEEEVLEELTRLIGLD